MSDYLRLVRQYTIVVLVAVFASMLVFSVAPGAGVAAFLLGLAIVAARMVFGSPVRRPDRVGERPVRPLPAVPAIAGGSGMGVAPRPESGGLTTWLRLSIAVLIEHESNVEGMLALVRR